MWALIALLMAMAAAGLGAADTTSCAWDGPRVDCGYSGIAQEECEGRGCCWSPAEFAGAPHVDLPWCFSPNGGASEYAVHDLRQGKGGSMSATLQLTTGTQPELGPDVEVLRLDVEPLSDTVLRLKLTDAAAPRWEVPTWLFAQSSLLSGSRGAGAGAGSTPQFRVAVREAPFSLEVSRAGSDGAALFNTTGTRGLVYKDQYLELTTWVSPTTTLFGAGERASNTLHLERNGMPRALWSHDLGPTFLEQNMYGSHPFVLALEQDGSAWGMLLLNSNAMDVVPTEDKLSWRVTGGVLDVFLLMGPTPLDVLDQLTAVVGRPAMMPHWGLGFHQCKYGYRSVWEVEEVVRNYSVAGLPLEVIWTDIDHMDGWRDFTFDQQNYPLPEMQRFVAQLHRDGQRWVPIVDPGIKVDPGYAPYDEGLKQDVFMRGVDGSPYMGQVWPGASHFPDFFSPRTRAWYSGLLQQHHGLVPWDGIWIDMDEVSNFCTGEICQLRQAGAAAPGTLRDDSTWDCDLECRDATATELNDTQRGWLNPPYAVSNSLSRLPLGFKARGAELAMSVLATHHDGAVQYNSHNLFSLSHCLATHQAVAAAAGTRPFVLSRSTFTGAGAYAAHWTGDNSATWEQLALSIPGVLQIGLWGIPFAGADICGFQGDTTPELCARWTSLGAFYPFARNHADLHSSYQELYRWPEVAAAGKRALGMRYRLLPYLYSAMHSAAQRGAPIMRPLWMNFPADAATHTTDRQFMLGDALLVSPVLQQGAGSVEAYFPPATWHSLWEDGHTVDARDGGKRVTLDAPLGEIPLHMKGGSALLMHVQAGLTTAETKRSPVMAVVALPEHLVAHGGGTGGPSAVLGAARKRAHISAHVYRDGGEELEIGTSLCNFLTLTATITHEPGGDASAEVLLLFGGPTHLKRSADCGAAGDIDVAADGAPEGPVLAGVRVLGWHLPARGVVAEVVRADACGRVAAVERLQVPVGAVGAVPGGLHLDLSALNHRLECPYGLRVSWVSGDGGVAAH